jgi:proline racemase
MEISTVEYHTGGEPFRIVPQLPVVIEGATVAERRVFAMRDGGVDGLRKLLSHEPRGHADMYGGFIVPPDDPGAQLGVLFWHRDGFSTACGHGTMALGAWAVRSGVVSTEPDGVAEVVIDVPSGRVSAQVHTENGLVKAVDFVNVPSYLLAADLSVPVGGDSVIVDVGYGGAIYAQVAASQFGLSVTKERHRELTAVGRELKQALNDTEVAKHPSDPRLDGIYGVTIYDDFGPDTRIAKHPSDPRLDGIYDDFGTDELGQLFQRSVTIFADGQLDRSPCGSGTAARLAVLHAKGELALDQVLVHDSIVGSRFLARIAAETTAEGRDAVIPVVTGTAYETGRATFTVDPEDPLVPGFLLR